MNDQLLAIADELREIQLEVFGILALDSESWKRDRLDELFEAYDDARLRLRQLVGSASVLSITGPEHASGRKLLQAALLEELPLDDLRSLSGSDTSIPWDFQDLEPLAEEMLTWFSQYEYAKNKLSGAVLVLNARSLGREAGAFVDEIVECYAFEQYTAVYALCRTALEASLRPVYHAHGMANPDSENSRRVRERIWRQRYPDWKKRRYTDEDRLYVEDFSPDLDQMITRLCWLDPFSSATVSKGISDSEPLRFLLHRIRDRGNSIIHANRTADKASAREMMRDLFASLHAVYEVRVDGGTQ